MGCRISLRAAFAALSGVCIIAIAWLGWPAGDPSSASLSALSFVRAAAAQPKTTYEDLSIETAAGKEPLRFEVEIARTPREKAFGLMFRRDLPRMRGMLFPYGEEQPISMWMKNTYIPLDMLFIRADGTVHRIEEMTEPFSERAISSEGDVAAVLEIAGGEARRLGIAKGDMVRHPLFSTEANAR